MQPWSTCHPSNDFNACFYTTTTLPMPERWIWPRRPCTVKASVGSSSQGMPGSPARECKHCNSFCQMNSCWNGSHVKNDRQDDRPHDAQWGTPCLAIERGSAFGHEGRNHVQLYQLHHLLYSWIRWHANIVLFGQSGRQEATTDKVPPSVAFGTQLGSR